ncbi:hypothetical protein [Salinarimonas soli]|uniref:Uncharacterized protein n=1 Tax=Salinarimonas soli TaxID=1638099 RepID=A0A5B2V8K3_9HYPH|nr:hypothetical protein [Salinarimonas soli]KAA2234790.1 hypothetical protein F0L46_22845 [Salinarimonas soli]
MVYQTIEQPFSTSSPWNVSIGAGATYQSASEPETAMIRTPSQRADPWVQQNSMTVYQATSTDPLLTWNYDARSTSEWTQGGETWGGSFKMHTPAGLQFETVDGWAIIVEPDGQHYFETWLGSYDAGSNSYHANYIVRNDLTTDGIAAAPGAHEGIRAAGLSLLGGLVRADELDSLEIDHAVAMAISVNQAQKGSTQADQFVWPATSSDGAGPSMYKGEVPIGALFAIPQWIDLDAIGLSTPEGRALAKAFQNYGGYVVDTAGDFTHVLAYVENGADQAQIDNLNKDVAKIRDQLSMVNNNSAEHPGGPGEGLDKGPVPASDSTIQVDDTPAASAGGAAQGMDVPVLAGAQHPAPLLQGTPTETHPEPAPVSASTGLPATAQVEVPDVSTAAASPTHWELPQPGHANTTGIVQKLSHSPHGAVNELLWSELGAAGRGNAEARVHAYTHASEKSHAILSHQSMASAHDNLVPQDVAIPDHSVHQNGFDPFAHFALM